MKGVLLALLTLFPLLCSANDYDAGRASGNDVLSAVLPGLDNMKPNEYFDAFTETPKETQLNHNTLKERALADVSNSDLSKNIINNYHKRGRVKLNDNSPEMQLSEKVIGDADENSEAICYQEPAHCSEEHTTSTCRQSVSYIEKRCSKQLEVTLNPIATHHTNRARVMSFQNHLSINLSVCEPGDWYCNPAQLIQMGESCEVLKTTVSSVWGNANVTITHQPTCTDLVLSLEFSQMMSGFVNLAIDVGEYFAQDNWHKGKCDDVNTGFCVAKGVNQCVKPLATKIIDGIAVTRDCWQKADSYDCITDYQGCEDLMTRGCSQTRSQCTKATGTHCDEFLQSYQCTTKNCFPEKTVCKEMLPCADDSCMPTEDSPGEDFAEGITKLGALNGSANEVSENQVHAGDPRIFTGSSKECTRLPIADRDCCTDSGLGSKIFQCPESLQALQRAKDDNRVFALGSYKHNPVGRRHYRYCVFPTKLAAIVQLQGRYQQLGLGFGTAHSPDCRGLTPEELERIDFSRLNLSELSEEFESQQSLPETSGMDTRASSQIEQMKDRGKPKGWAHD